MENNKINKKIARKASRVCSAFATCKLINHSFITKISFLYVNKKSRIDKDRSNRNRLSLPDKEGESIVKNDTNGRKRRVFEVEYTNTVDSHTYEFELKEVDIPFDVIIGRKSIVDYHLLRYDRDLTLYSLKSRGKMVS
jgi:hypothetical protein